MVVLPQKRFPKRMKVKIAICQIFCLDSDDLGNFIRIENALIEAKKGGADIACFPETTILGWIKPDAHKMAHPIPGKYY
jgi:predicted amidohydrolase